MDSSTNQPSHSRHGSRYERSRGGPEVTKPAGYDAVKAHYGGDISGISASVAGIGHDTHLVQPLIERQDSAFHMNADISHDSLPVFDGFGMGDYDQQNQFEMNEIDWRKVYLVDKKSNIRIEAYLAANRPATLEGVAPENEFEFRECYNCHALALTKQTNIWIAYEDFSKEHPVQIVINHFDFQPVDPKQAVIGDLVVYRDMYGTITHSARVTQSDENNGLPQVDSKFGDLPAYPHRIDDVPSDYRLPDGSICVEVWHTDHPDNGYLDIGE